MICNLTEATEGLRDYESELAGIAGEMGVEAGMKRFVIPDVNTTIPEHTMQILDWARHEERLRDERWKDNRHAEGNADATQAKELRPGAVQRAQGCLLGQLAGDSLGSLVEFRSPQSIRKEYPNGVRELADGGRWQTIAGQATDDTEMALALARTIVRLGSYDLEQAGVACKRWLDSRTFDVGNTVRGSLSGE